MEKIRKKWSPPFVEQLRILASKGRKEKAAGFFVARKLLVHEMAETLKEKLQTGADKEYIG